MANVKNFGDLMMGFRAELRHSLDPAKGKNTQDRFELLLNNTQEELFYQYDWDHRKVYRYIPVRAGQRYYDWPADLNEHEAYSLEYKYQGYYYPLKKGIGAANLTIFDSDKDQRSEPLLKWDFHLDDNSDKTQFEVWPTPNGDGFVYTDTTQPAPARETQSPNKNPDGTRFIRLRGIKHFTKMVETTDKTVLDGRLIELMAAAKEAYLQDMKGKEVIQAAAQSHLRRLLSRLKKTDPFLMGTDITQRTPENFRSRTRSFRYAQGPNSTGNL